MCLHKSHILVLSRFYQDSFTSKIKNFNQIKNKAVLQQFEVESKTCNPFLNQLKLTNQKFWRNEYMHLLYADHDNIKNQLWQYTNRYQCSPLNYMLFFSMAAILWFVSKLGANYDFCRIYIFTKSFVVEGNLQNMH